MGNTTDSQQNTEKTSESKQNTDNTNECKESQPHMDRYDVQWLDDGQILYDYHRYLKCQRQPDSLKPKEHQFGCYLRGCKHTIRVRLTGDGKWVVTQNNMHDSESVHKACQHELHTPNAIETVFFFRSDLFKMQKAMDPEKWNTLVSLWRKWNILQFMPSYLAAFFPGNESAAKEIGLVSEDIVDAASLLQKEEDDDDEKDDDGDLNII
eukprot:756211_1